eukprot:TRINITY_DN40727_c0_g1_i1.p1 TRINITY_DN40727_c0_g1~~TRINITY_DN40727_c0_g1_i1.p1  ORF type:complete len:126 (+),score=9.20 TRINITY_DN40727_c0_g1_i1:93-470(+)
MKRGHVFDDYVMRGAPHSFSSPETGYSRYISTVLKSNATDTWLTLGLLQYLAQLYFHLGDDASAADALCEWRTSTYAGELLHDRGLFPVVALTALLRLLQNAVASAAECCPTVETRCRTTAGLWA